MPLRSFRLAFALPIALVVMLALPAGEWADLTAPAGAVAAAPVEPRAGVVTISGTASAAASGVAFATLGSFTESTGPQFQHAVGGTLFVNTSRSGSFVARVVATSAAGMTDVTFPALGSGWLPAGVQVDTTGVADGFDGSYTWMPGAVAPGLVQAVARDDVAATANAPFAVVADTTAPTGAAISTAVGPGGITATFTTGTDTQSDVGSWVVQRRIAAFDGTACGTFGPYGQVSGISVASPFIDSSVARGNCYEYRLRVRDNVDNTIDTAGAGAHQLAAVISDSSPPAVAGLSIVAGTNPSAQHSAGSTYWINPSRSGSFRVHVPASDGQSGIRGVAFEGTGAGWAPSPALDTVAPFESTLAWSPGASGLELRATATSNAGLSSSAAFSVQADGVGPTGVGVVVGALSSGLRVPISVTSGSDAQSGYRGWELQRSIAPVQGAGCGAFGAFVTIIVGTDDVDHVDTGGAIRASTCLGYRVVATDKVGNTSTTKATSVLVFNQMAGTARADRLTGTSLADAMSGRAGDDRLSGGGGNDRVDGGAGLDTLFGGAGDDLIAGGTGNDLLDGGAGADTLLGGPGRDRFVGGPGSDTIGARDKTRDQISCGLGRDTVIADRLDLVARDCEAIKRG